MKKINLNATMQKLKNDITFLFKTLNCPITTLLVATIILGGSTLNAHPFFDMDYHEVRKLINSKCMDIDAEQPEVSTIKEHQINASGLDTILRIYTPNGEGKFPLILFIHGGVWVAGNLETHDNLARYLCKKVQAVVVSVEYKNSPEGKFPVPLEQSYEALLWATNHTELLQIDDRAAVVGDSAGGNMAAALCLMTRDRRGPKIDFQVLINPAPDLSCNGTLEIQEDKLDVLRWQAKMYTKTSEEVYLPYVSPSLAEDLTGLPPALVVVAELDDLRYDGESYASKLRVAGVPTNIYCQWGINHLAGHGARASETAVESLDIAVASLLGAFNRIKEIKSQQ